MEADLYQRFYEIENVHWWFVARKAIVLSLLDHYLPRGSGRVVLDAGCGTGGLLEDLERYGELVAVDSSGEAVKFCKLRGYEIVQCSILDTPFRPATFDVVIGLDVIEHVDDDLAALQELYRVCRPGGLLLATVPAFQFLWSHHDEMNHHKRRYTRRDLATRLQVARFEVLRCSYFNCYLFPFMLAGRLVGHGGGEEMGPELTVPSPMINHLLSRTFAAELPLLRRIDLPFGGSVLGVAKKPG